ncbi:MAG: hypothetical protein QXR30_01065 [Candidatus Woesearchaeota archaeon]
MNDTNFVFIFSDYFSKKEIREKLEKNLDIYLEYLKKTENTKSRNCQYLYQWDLFPYFDNFNNYILTYNPKSKTSKDLINYIIAEAAQNLENEKTKSKKKLEKCILDGICYEINRRVTNVNAEYVLNNFKRGYIFETNKYAKDINFIKVLPLEEIFRKRKKEGKSFDYATLAEVYKILENFVNYRKFLEGSYFIEDNNPKEISLKFISTIEKPLEEFEFFIENGKLNYRRINNF